VRAHLPVGAGPDIVRELESSIRDRADAVAAGRGSETDDAAICCAIEEVGDPEDFAAAYVPRHQLVAPEHTRSLLLWTALAFAVHLSLVGVATSLGRAIHFGPVAIAPVGPHGLLSLLASAAHALLLDVGLMVLAFAAAPRLHGVLARGTRGLGTDAAPRSAGARAVLAVLVACVLGLFRDRLFVVVEGATAHPLFTPWFGEVMPLVLGVLGLAVVGDVLYLVLGETRVAVAADALHGAVTLGVMVHLLRGEPVLEVPPVPAFADFRGPVNGFLQDLGTLVLLFLAVAAAVKTVRRLVRVSQV
jgi:hypothetical protein